MLGQIEDVIKEEQPDALLICGDIYDLSQPSAAVQKLFAEAVNSYHRACQDMTIIITAGNHDSAARHEIFRTPWKALNVHVIGSLDRSNPENHIIEIPGKGYVAAVPYVNERNLPDNFYNNLLDLAAEKNKDGLPVVLTAHTTVSGCDFMGHSDKTDRTVGGIETYNLSEITSRYDYLALGHIHRQQTIGGRARYSGTPIAVSFDEEYNHSITVVTLEKGGEMPIIDTIEIDNPIPLVTLPVSGFVEWEKAKKMLEDFTPEKPSYIRLNVEIDDFLPSNAEAEAAMTAEAKGCRFCRINATRKAGRIREIHTLSVQEFQQEKPVNIARMYLESIGVPFTDELNSMFNEVLAAVDEDDKNA